MSGENYTPRTDTEHKSTRLKSCLLNGIFITLLLVTIPLILYIAILNFLPKPHSSAQLLVQITSTNPTTLTHTSTAYASATITATPTDIPTPRPTGTSILTAAAADSSTGQVSSWIHYNNAKKYYDETAHVTDLWSYRQGIENARNEIDLAITGNPQNGDYYLLRNYIYQEFAVITDIRAEYEYYMGIALENLRMALALGNSEEFTDRVEPLLLFSLGRCDEGMNVLQRIKDEHGVAPPSASLFNIEALGYICMGQLDQALVNIDRGLAFDPLPDRKFLRAETLYQLGRFDEALEALNELIEDKPQYGGARYYLRALIYYLRGNIDLAEQDLQTGSWNTWGQFYTRSYVLGRMALDAGDTQAAIEHLQMALATLSWHFDTTLIPDIERRLSSLNASPLPIQDSGLIHTTPIPSPQVSPTAQRTEALPNFIPTPANPVTFDMNEGTNKLNCLSCTYPVYLFQPPEPMIVSSIQSLTLHLLSSIEQGPTPFKVFIWEPATGQWVLFSPQWGENPITDPARFVDPGGQIYINLRYPTGQSGPIDNIWFTLVATRDDGSQVVIDHQE